jgi:NAD(P)H-dependent flavin oxidoreductase YrpB (nitropropane dioxygenase family)
VAALALGAEGINMGTRFLLTQESPLHPAVKQRMVAAGELDTVLIGRTYRDPSRLLKNSVTLEALERERLGGATYQDLYPLIGAPRWMKAAEEGDVEGGAFPAGLSVALIHDVPTCADLMTRIVSEAKAIVNQRLHSAMATTA